MSTSRDTITTRQATLARNAVMIVFAANGFGFASWMARIPQIRDALGLQPSELGRVLLALAIGAVIALPTSGFVVNKIGAARTVAGGSVLAGGSLIMAGIGVDPIASVVAVAAFLATLGYGTGTWDVAMNVEGAAVERQLDRAIMPRFHAAFSLGTVLGAALGAAATWLSIAVPIHLGVTGAAVIVVTLVSTRNFLPRQTEESHDDATPAAPKVPVWHAWREPRTLLIGLLVLSFALIEGIANDWLAVGLVDGYEVSNAVGSAGFAVFVAAMTLGRLSGPWFLDRYGRAPVVRTSGLLAATGAFLVVISGNLVLAGVGILLWGIGASLGFPVGMSAASDEPHLAPARVSVVASIGYTAFLAGPPLLGWIGDHEGVLTALAVATGAGLLGTSVASVLREKKTKTPERVDADRR
ncbi:MFS transporter [Phytoactinopolyspora halotolerans]|uniref:MFS transporter n=1 Tax=Phytoactinopolyspora halotolerans TaxID=1981512 RepID=A0A6L9S355_9ACTN|nr:MFS transporter [Phytoactinopolyspora halotolerans]NED98847.1 MFS transporter [Phytoactinopolyspora halotolerans]